MPRCCSYAFLIVIAAFILSGCKSSSSNADGALVAAREDTVAAVPLLNRRVYVHKADALPSGDIVKRWHWDTPWEIRNVAGGVIRRMYSPDWSADAPKNDGPHVTVIQDPRRGTIFEAFFVQKTDTVFNLPMTLYFFATRESLTPLFSLSFTDSAAGSCPVRRVSRGDIKAPAIPQSLFESAEWVGVGWQSTTYETC